MWGPEGPRGPNNEVWRLCGAVGGGSWGSLSKKINANLTTNIIF